VDSSGIVAEYPRPLLSEPGERAASLAPHYRSGRNSGVSLAGDSAPAFGAEASMRLHPDAVFRVRSPAA
jgi:hypothetical protein